MPTQSTSHASGALTIATFSDLHFSQDPEWRVLFPGNDYSPAKRSELVVESMLLAEFDMMVDGGDLIDRGDVGSYRAIDRLLSQRGAGIPLYTTPGNHDRTAELFDSVGIGAVETRSSENNKFNYSVRKGPHHLLFVDSSPITEGRGEIGPTGLEWLMDALTRVGPNEFAWVFTHYPALPFSHLLPERSMMVDGFDFHSLMIQFSAKVSGVFHGHIHTRREYTIDGIQYHSIAPSSVPMTCVEKGKGILDVNGALGFEILRLFNDGRLERTMVPVDVSSSVIPPVPNAGDLT